MSQIERSMPIGVVLSQLGLVDLKKAPMVTSSLRSKTWSFQWLNVGAQETLASVMLGTIQETDWLMPPRTAHIGSVWPNILAGGGADLMLNHAVISEKSGYGLIFDLNQLPDNEGTRGDTLYHPEKRWVGDRYEDLPVFTWNGKDFQARNREEPLFTPMVMTQVDGKMIPIVQLHRQDMLNAHSGFKFVSQEIVSHPNTRDIMASLVKQASQGDSVIEINQTLSDIFDRHVTSDGIVHSKGVSQLVNGHYQVGSTEYGSVDELVSAALNVFELAADPENLFQIGKYPECLPLVSKETLVTLMALLDTDKSNRIPMADDVNIHVHFGALSMAGLPNTQYSGYFSGSASQVNRVTSIARSGLKENGTPVPPVYMALVPAAIYLTYPSAEDIQAVNELMSNIQDETANLRNRPNVVKQKIDNLVSSWTAKFASLLSPAFVSRFSRYDSTLTTKRPESPQLIQPDVFPQMTFLQLGLIVGALKDNLREI